MTQLAPGAHALIRDEEWLIRRVDPSADGGWLLTCDGISDLVRGQTALFLTALEGEIAVLDPDGTQVEMTVTDDTLPGGPRQVTRTFTAPFARANREDDYRRAWTFFEQMSNSAGTAAKSH